MRLTHILCPTDYSEPAATALEHAVAVAGWYSARVTLLHVCSGPPAEADRVRLLDEAATVRDVARPHASVEVALAEGDPEETAHLPIGLFGASTGGGAALIGAAARPHEIAAVVSRGGGPDVAHEALGRATAPTLLIVGGEDRPVLDVNRRATSSSSISRRAATSCRQGGHHESRGRSCVGRGVGRGARVGGESRRSD